MIELTIGRIMFGWIVIINFSLICMAKTKNDSTIFKIGPSDTLVVLENPIDDYFKYTIVVLFCLVNSAFRTLNSNMLHSWVINNVQDTEKEIYVSSAHAFEISFITTLYTWFDFFMYMNILMAQIDLFAIEVVVDLMMVSLVTKYYLCKNKKYDEYISLV